jgi:hypothetical protein
MIKEKKGLCSMELVLLWQNYAVEALMPNVETE